MYEISEVTAKVKKLLALAERAGTDAEAVAAAARAQELIERYNLSIGLELLEGEQAVERDSGGGGTARISPHTVILARAACRLFDCDFYSQSEPIETQQPRYRYSYRRTIRFVGLEQNVEACILTFHYFSASVESLLLSIRNTAHTWTRPDYRGYRLGCAKGIISIVKEVKQQRVEIGGDQTKELVRIGRDIARRHVESMKMGSPLKVSAHPGFSDEAYAQGYQDGQKVDIHGARTSRMLSSKAAN